MIRLVLITCSSLTLLILLSLNQRVLRPLVLTSVSSVILFKSLMAAGIEISDLNFRGISWLAYLAGLDRPAGIIHNQSDTILWVNAKSRLQVGAKTTANHLDNGKLANIRATVEKLDDVDLEHREQSFLAISYVLRFNEKPVRVKDRFYKLIIGTECFRIFECLEIEEI